MFFIVTSETTEAYMDFTLSQLDFYVSCLAVHFCTYHPIYLNNRVFIVGRRQHHFPGSCSFCDEGRGASSIQYFLTFAPKALDGMIRLHLECCILSISSLLQGKN